MFKNTLYFDKINDKLFSLHVKEFLEEFHSKEVGYYHLPANMSSIVHRAKKLQNNSIKDVLILGIGGSSLGVKAISSMIRCNKVNMHFLENLDARSTKEILQKIDKKSTKIFIISKSGTTLETLSLTKVVINELKIKEDEYKELFLIVTDPDSSLEKFALKHKVELFYIPKNVGGRFSVFSSCGIVPLTLCGYDTNSLLDGANACKQEYIDKENRDIFQKAYRYCFGLNENINILFSYADALKEFNAWYIQLWAESLGKKNGKTRVGLTPIGLIGSTDQHSFLQLIIDGPKDKSVTFIKQKIEKSELLIPDIKLDYLPNDVKNLHMHEVLNMQCDATLQSVKKQNITTDIIEIDTIDEWHIGYLMYYYKLLTSICGIMLRVNTYNQPGVEIGKKILKDMLSSNNTKNSN